MLAWLLLTAWGYTIIRTKSKIKHILNMAIFLKHEHYVFFRRIHLFCAKSSQQLIFTQTAFQYQRNRYTL